MHSSNRKICTLLISFLSTSLIYWQFISMNNFKIQKYTYARKSIKSKYERHIIPDLGEWGMPALLNDSAKNLTEIEHGLQKYGLNVWLSERISLKRKLPDVRDERCQINNYDNNLPNVSLILSYHNEHPSIILRTLHSFYARTPAKLLAEIILVNDASVTKELNSNVFRNYIKKTFGAKLKHLQLAKQIGLMRARVLGAKAATGEVLIFLDADLETTENWLPPLLAPIKLNPKTCTTPILDAIDGMTFEYFAGSAARVGFDWELNFVEMPLTESEMQALPAPHKNPIMNAGLFAINAAWFWHLGAYDAGLEIWNGERLELSLKIWTCGGGEILEVPCSRVGHVTRKADFDLFHTNNETDDYIIRRNYRRIIDVWFDEYSSYVYARNLPLKDIPVGNLSKQFALRKRLKCKNFKWYAENVAKDIFKFYPAVEPVDYAFGALQSVAAPELCLDANDSYAAHALLTPCPKDIMFPSNTQFWQMTFRHDLRQATNGICLEVRDPKGIAKVWRFPCHLRGGNQFWYYAYQSKQLVHGEGIPYERCLELDMIGNGAAAGLIVNVCDSDRNEQKWNFGYFNKTALDYFFKEFNNDDNVIIYQF